MSNREMPPLPPPTGDAGLVTVEKKEVEKAETKQPEVKVGRTIEVIATRPGFYKCHRRAIGDKFAVDFEGFDKLGTWYEPLDSQFKKKQLEAIKARKEKLKAEAAKAASK